MFHLGCCSIPRSAPKTYTLYCIEIIIWRKQNQIVFTRSFASFAAKWAFYTMYLQHLRGSWTLGSLSLVSVPCVPLGLACLPCLVCPLFVLHILYTLFASRHLHAFVINLPMSSKFLSAFCCFMSSLPVVLAFLPLSCNSNLYKKL